MGERQECAICNRADATATYIGQLQTFDFECSRCGNYLIAEPAYLQLLNSEPKPSRFRAVLSEWVDNQNSNGEKPTITSDKAS